MLRESVGGEWVDQAELVELKQNAVIIDYTGTNPDGVRAVDAAPDAASNGDGPRGCSSHPVPAPGCRYCTAAKAAIASG